MRTENRISPVIISHMQILLRIASRGRTMAYDSRDSSMLDMWEHVHTEMLRLLRWMEDYNDGD